MTPTEYIFRLRCVVQRLNTLADAGEIGFASWHMMLADTMIDLGRLYWGRDPSDLRDMLLAITQYGWQLGGCFVMDEMRGVLCWQPSTGVKVYRTSILADGLPEWTRECREHLRRQEQQCKET